MFFSVNKKKLKVTTETKKVPEARARQLLALQELRAPLQGCGSLAVELLGPPRPVLSPRGPTRPRLRTAPCATVGTAKELHTPHPELAPWHAALRGTYQSLGWWGSWSGCSGQPRPRRALRSRPSLPRRDWLPPGTSRCSSCT